jgi:hypothetical protein
MTWLCRVVHPLEVDVSDLTEESTVFNRYPCEPF